MIVVDNKFEYHGRFFPYLLICLFVLISYIPSFTGEFIMDDIPLVEKNSYLKEWHSIGSYLTQEDGYNKDSGGHTGYYRPLINLSYTLDYKIWGMFAPGFRVTNLILHLLACFSLFIFYNLIFQKRNIALMLALIFSLHPVNTETVSWITSRNNILVTLFGILSLIFYINAYKKQKFHQYILAIMFFTLSIFSKEFGLMLLPIFFLYQRIFKDGRKITFIELREYIPFVFVAAIYFLLRQEVIDSIITPADISDILTRIYNVPYILFLNLKLIFIPFKLHSFFIQYPEGFLNFASLICVLFFLVIVSLMWIYRKNRIFIFSIISFFIISFPVLNIIPTSAPYLIAMRWLYFPLPFILTVLSFPLEKLFGWNKRMAMFLLTGLILYLGFNTYMLNRFLWHSVKDFFKQEVLHFNNVYYVDGMAFIYGQENKTALAMKLHEKSIEEGIRLERNYIEYAELLLEKGDPEKALEYLNKARGLCFSSDRLGLILNDKGLAFLKLNKLEEAERYIRQAINLSPEESVYRENLGVVQGAMGRHMDAVQSFKKAIRLGIDSSSIFKNMANGYLAINECEKAAGLLKRVNIEEKDPNLNNLMKRAEKCLAEKKGKYRGINVKQ